MKIKNYSKTEQHKVKHIGEGHRKRLRDRFLKSGFDGFLDYEIVELLLTLGTPRKDCKQMAKAAIKAFGGLRGTLDARLDQLRQIKGIGPSNAFGVKLFQAMAERYAKEKITSKTPLTSPRAVANFLIKSIGKEDKEHFVVLSLDARNNLIKISKVSVGSLNASIVHPREVFEPAVRHLAAQVILAHNHPSGNVEPSEGDLVITKRLIEAGEILGIEIMDHVIITTNNFYSFKENDLI